MEKRKNKKKKNEDEEEKEKEKEKEENKKNVELAEVELAKVEHPPSLPQKKKVRLRGGRG